MNKKLEVHNQQSCASVTVDQFPTLDQWRAARTNEELVAMLNWSSRRWGYQRAWAQLKAGTLKDGAYIRIPESIPKTPADKAFADIQNMDPENKAQLATMMRDRGLAQELKDARDSFTHEGI